MPRVRRKTPRQPIVGKAKVRAVAHGWLAPVAEGQDVAILAEALATRLKNHEPNSRPVPDWVKEFNRVVRRAEGNAWTTRCRPFGRFLDL